jgi:hypothetical protein
VNNGSDCESSNKSVLLIFYDEALGIFKEEFGLEGSRDSINSGTQIFNS